MDFHLWCKPSLTVLSDSQVCCCFWAVPSAKFSVIVPSANQLYISHFKSKIASSHHNSLTSTLILLLGTPFNTISCFSDHLAYPLNALWQSRQIYQRGHSSLRSPSSIVQPGQTVLSVPGPSIVPVDNDPN